MTDRRATYSEAFYRDRDAMTRHAAETVLDFVFALEKPAGVVDVGCGTGTWLAAARRLGATDCVGVEGTWLDPAQANTDSMTLHQQDLEAPIALDQAFDLAISLEVAEHLTPARGPGFVAELCGLAPMVLFSAAVPGQGGKHHVNERWQSYWADLFEGEGYTPVDIVRPAVWADDAVPYWYCQNTLLYLSEAKRTQLSDRLDTRPPRILDLVHPRQFAFKHRDRVAVGRNARLLLKAIGRSLRGDTTNAAGE